MQPRRFGPFRAIVRGGSEAREHDDALVTVLLHGYGAPGEDLVDLAQLLAVPPTTRFVFPEAPLQLDDGYGRAWWPLDPSLFERRARGERIDRSEDVPATLGELREQLLAFVTALESHFGVTRDRVVLGGFSQGSMLACDVALHSETPFGGLVLLSSTLIARSSWSPRRARLAGTPVLQTHGRSDPLLAFEDAERLRDLLREGGAELTFVPFEGGHELPREALDALSRFLSARA